MKVGSVVMIKKAMAHYGMLCNHCESQRCNSIGIVIKIYDNDISYGHHPRIHIHMNCSNARDGTIYFCGYNQDEQMPTVIVE